MNDECYGNFPFNDWQERFCIKCNRATECAYGAVLEKQGDELLAGQYDKQIAELYASEPDMVQRILIKHQWAKNVIRQHSVSMN